MPSSDKEVFDLIRRDPESSTELDFLTYAMYAFEKYQWFDHFESLNGRLPERGEIDAWIGQLTEFRFRSMREEAARLFDEAARTYLSDYIAEEKRLAIERSIVAEVKASGGFWRQMSIALMTAILAPLIIGAMIAAALTYDKLTPTASEVAKTLQRPADPAQAKPTTP